MSELKYLRPPAYSKRRPSRNVLISRWGPIALDTTSAASWDAGSRRMCLEMPHPEIRVATSRDARVWPVMDAARTSQG